MEEMPPHDQKMVDLIERYLFKVSVLCDNEGRLCRFQMGTKPSHNMPWIPHGELPSKNQPGPCKSARENMVKPLHQFIVFMISL